VKSVKKRKKSSSQDEPIKHLDCLHKINDIIAELEKKVATDPPKMSTHHKPDSPKQHQAISYPQPGVAYSLTPPQIKHTSPTHIGFPNPNKVSAPAWLGLTVAPGSVSTAINPMPNPLVPSTEHQVLSGDMSEEEDQSPVKKSLFTDIFKYERPNSPELEPQSLMGSSTVGRSEARGELGAKLSNLLQDRIINRVRGKDSDLKRRSKVDFSRNGTTSQSRSSSRDRKKKREKRKRSRSYSREKTRHDVKRQSRKKSRSRSRKKKDKSNNDKRRSSSKKRYTKSRSPSQTRKKKENNNSCNRANSISSKSRCVSNKAHKTRKRSCSNKRKRSESSERTNKFKSKKKSRSRSNKSDFRSSRRGSNERENLESKTDRNLKLGKADRSLKKYKKKNRDCKPRDKSKSRSQNVEEQGRGKVRKKSLKNSEDNIADKDDLRKYLEKIKTKNTSELLKTDANLNTTVSDNDTDASDDEKIIRKRRINRLKFLASFKDDEAELQENNGNRIEEDKAIGENIPIAFFDQADEDIDLNHHPIVFFDAEVLQDGSSSHVLQLGAFSTIIDKEFTFFKYMQPNLLQGDQLEALTTDSKFELMDCLRLKTSKFDVTHSGKLNINFKHPELGSIPAENERNVLVSFISFLNGLKSGDPVILVTHRKDTVLPALFSLLTKHDLLGQFSSQVVHCCELVHLAWELHMDHLWQGARYPGLRSVAQFVNRELQWDDGYLPSDKISSLLCCLVERMRKEHKLGVVSRFVEKCGGVGVVDYMTAKYNLIQSASGSRGGVDRPDHVEVVRGSDQWGRKIRIDLKWKQEQNDCQSRNNRRTPVPEPDLILEDGEDHVRILKPEESKSMSHRTRDISWSDRTYNTFLPPGVSKIAPLSTTTLILRIPALKPRISELVGFPVLVKQNIEFTQCNILRGTQVLSQPSNSMFPVVEAMFQNGTKEELCLDSKIINFAVANIRLDSRYEK